MPPDAPTDDEQGLREECLDHLDALFGAALRMTKNRHDAQDLVQETYLKAVRNLHRYRAEAGCKSWLFTILTNTYIDLYRKRKRRPEKVEFDDEGATGIYDRIVSTFPADEDEGPLHSRGDLEDFLHRFMPDEVKAAIDELPDIHREVIILRDLEGFAYKECADMLDIPVGTVMSRLYRARKALQEALWEYAARRGYAASNPAAGGGDS